MTSHAKSITILFLNQKVDITGLSKLSDLVSLALLLHLFPPLLNVFLLQYLDMASRVVLN